MGYLQDQKDRLEKSKIKLDELETAQLDSLKAVTTAEDWSDFSTKIIECDKLVIRQIAEVSNTSIRFMKALRQYKETQKCEASYDFHVMRKRVEGQRPLRISTSVKEMTFTYDEIFAIAVDFRSVVRYFNDESFSRIGPILEYPTLFLPAPSLPESSPGGSKRSRDKEIAGQETLASGEGRTQTKSARSIRKRTASQNVPVPPEPIEDELSALQADQRTDLARYEAVPLRAAVPAPRPSVVIIPPSPQATHVPLDLQATALLLLAAAAAKILGPFQGPRPISWVAA